MANAGAALEQTGPLGIDVALRSARPPAGEAVLTNFGCGAVRLWQTGNSWGDDALSFVVMLEETAFRVTRIPQVYTRNIPSSLVVLPGDAQRLPFNLGDGSWEAGAPFDRLWSTDARLVAVYEVLETPESREQGVWTGRIESGPVPLDGTPP